MVGWQVSFDLPAGDSLISSWNGKFATNGSHVTVTSLEPNVAVASGATIQLGYCASAQADDVAVTPGNCVVQDGNTQISVPATSLNSAIDTNFNTINTGAFQFTLASDGYTTQCPADANTITAGSNGLLLGACSGVQWQSPVLYGITSVNLRATAGAGIVTQVATSVALPSGLQGLAMAVSGSNPNSIALTVWQNGTATEQTVDLGFDATQAVHAYTMAWQASGITWTVDGNTVGKSSTLPAVSPEYLNLSVWSANGTPSWAGTADPNTSVTPAQFSSLIFAPTVAIE
jgi:hypothetical protein